jgi:hypothetical protein
MGQHMTWSYDGEAECEECGRAISPIEAEDSYDVTFQVGRGGSVLCGKHLDEQQRERVTGRWD